VDAIASRDWVLRLLQSAAIYGVTLSRLANRPHAVDHRRVQLLELRMNWSIEFCNAQQAQSVPAGTCAGTGWRRGSEHLSPRPAPCSRSHSRNSIAVGTEGVQPLFGALRQIAEASMLLRLTVRERSQS